MSQQSPKAARSTAHKYALGQTVTFMARPYETAGSGVYKIVGQLPSQDGEFSYRIKSNSEPHERRVLESQLSR